MATPRRLRLPPRNPPHQRRQIQENRPTRTIRQLELGRLREHYFSQSTLTTHWIKHRTLTRRRMPCVIDISPYRYSVFSPSARSQSQRPVNRRLGRPLPAKQNPPATSAVRCPPRSIRMSRESLPTSIGLRPTLSARWAAPPSIAKGRSGPWASYSSSTSASRSIRTKRAVSAIRRRRVSLVQFNL